MAVASGFATTLAGAKLETLLLNSSKSSSSSAAAALRGHSSNQVRLLCKPTRNCRRALVQRGGIRCDVSASDVTVESGKVDPSNASTISALEQLKISGADSMFSFVGFSILMCSVKCLDFVFRVLR
ncbi:glutamyl-tRNA reductase 1 chloroplastic-like [Tripterygium wilfordii]|uniref:Glutamyl-tRNA reductase 1 chloroplastic-like n=1 Tax=Tripterygium wilfordii TaxID=458696 RepID=A0A7J7D0F2_TRIWF|nr:glutamyl-tRNA reductase 1 chloroplastic-like [Tripterygium wilfordii]